MLQILGTDGGAKNGSRDSSRLKTLTEESSALDKTLSITEKII